jgi:hypothetical protein
MNQYFKCCTCAFTVLFAVGHLFVFISYYGNIFSILGFVALVATILCNVQQGR